jgi:hypothetical protein
MCAKPLDQLPELLSPFTVAFRKTARVLCGQTRVKTDGVMIGVIRPSLIQRGSSWVFPLLLLSLFLAFPVFAQSLDDLLEETSTAKEQETISLPSGSVKTGRNPLEISERNGDQPLSQGLPLPSGVPALELAYQEPESFFFKFPFFRRLFGLEKSVPKQESLQGRLSSTSNIPGPIPGAPALPNSFSKQFNFKIPLGGSFHFDVSGRHGFKFSHILKPPSLQSPGSLVSDLSNPTVIVGVGGEF